MTSVWFAAAAPWLALAAKMLLAAAVVVVLCLVVEHTGPMLGGIIATLPVTAGAAIVFLATEHGAAFIAAGAPAGIVGVGGTGAFVTVYAALARRHGRLVSNLAALAAWIVTAEILHALAPGLWQAILGDVAVFLASYFIVRRWRHAPVRALSRASHWDIPVRAGAAMLLVFVVVIAGRLFGAAIAGMLALAPVVMTSIGVLLYHRLGGPGIAAVMANTLPGLVANALALLAMGLTAVALGATLSLLLALAVTLGFNALVVGLARWRHKKAP